MAYLINEKRAVDDNLLIYEKRIKSPTARLQDTTPIFVTYMHISNEKSTTDTGFKDVASIVGARSPIRFDKIENFPIYNLEQVVLQLQETDFGMDSEYNGEATILPGTIIPMPNDFFMIPTLRDPYVFRITDITYDNIMPDNFYRISFQLEWNDEVKVQELEEQVLNSNVCILENIGTEERCIIEKSIFTEICEIETMYRNICDFYKSMYYNERHNVFLGTIDPYYRIFDPLQTEFINKHHLFNEKMDLKTLMLTNQFDDPQRKFKYNRSVYRFVELRDLKLLSNFRYVLKPAVAIHESSFYRWHSKNVQMVDMVPNMGPNNNQIFSDEFKDAVFMNGDTNSEHGEFLKRFVRKEELKVKDIPLTLADELIYFNNSLEVFFFTPIMLYIIREIIKEETKVTTRRGQ